MSSSQECNKTKKNLKILNWNKFCSFVLRGIVGAILYAWNWRGCAWNFGRGIVKLK